MRLARFVYKDFNSTLQLSKRKNNVSWFVDTPRIKWNDDGEIAEDLVIGVICIHNLASLHGIDLDDYEEDDGQPIPDTLEDRFRVIKTNLGGYFSSYKVIKTKLEELDTVFELIEDGVIVNTTKSFDETFMFVNIEPELVMCKIEDEL